MLKLIKPAIFSIGVILVTTLTAYISADQTFEDLLIKLQTLSAASKQEKVHLHFDKPYYTAGDHIWFKAYTMDEQTLKPSEISEIIYVDLISERKVIKGLKLPMLSGTAAGSFVLPDTLPEGNYSVRAYTQWMRNAGEKFFFDKTIAIGNLTSTKVFEYSSFDFKQARATWEVISTIVFKDKDGLALTNKKVALKLQRNGKITYLPSELTDASGKIQFIFPFDTNLSGSGKISASIKISQKEEITKEITVPENNQLVDVQFYSESGSIVKGIPSKVVVKAINRSRKGEVITGTFMNQDEQITFNTDENGLGHFFFTAASTAPLKATIKFKQTEKVVELPEIKASGYTMSVDARTGAKRVNIALSPDLINKGGLHLVGLRNGTVFFDKPIKDDKQLTAINVHTANLPSGILQLTLFSSKNIPVAERYVFVNDLKERFDLEMEGLKDSYATRAQVNLSANALPGSYSVSVTRTDAVVPDLTNESNILSSFFLLSDVESYIERPNQYFQPGMSAAADFLMLSGLGFRNIPWARLQEPALPAATFQAEKVMVVSGTITNGGKPVVSGKLTLMKAAGGIDLLTATSDAQGRFRFDSLLLSDSTKLLIQARTGGDKKNVKIILDEIPGQKITSDRNTPEQIANVNEELNTYIRQSENFFKEQQSKGLFKSSISIEQVTITTQRNTSAEVNNGFVRKFGKADQEFNAAELDSVPFLTSFLTGKIRGKYRDYGVLIDGLNPATLGESSEHILQSIEPSTVERVEVLSSPHLISHFGGKRMILITLEKRKDGMKYFDAPGVLTFMPNGFSTVKQFNSPNYIETEDKRSDFRTTVYWNPDVEMDSNGKLKISYFNTDLAGKYRIVIEGLTNDGAVLHKEMYYNVM